MQWSKLCWEKSFQKRIILNDIVPKVGRTYPVSLTWNEDHVSSGKANFLWTPPHSELNGWEERPSEIEKSFVLSGELKAINSVENQYEFTILDVKLLLDVVEEQEICDRFKLPSCGLPDGNSYIIWDRARIDGAAKIGNFVYISGTECETALEAIIEINNANYYLVYHAYLPPAQHTTIVTKKYLCGDELLLLRK